MHSIRLISFGYLHLLTGLDGSPVRPAADRIEDVRDRLRDPAAARDILDLDGLNPRLQDIVLNTPGARELLANLTDYANIPASPRCIAIGCAGGKHRVVDRTTEGRSEREPISLSALGLSTSARRCAVRPEARRGPQPGWPRGLFAFLEHSGLTGFPPGQWPT
ncbi:hypothetical protein AB1388_11740 [Streptomyces hydrogenans]|uniref:RapZ C-terminal domain-containing protein n=1 Tax=Streptomyces hydrogenans TaxID=1873719 RepID=UPI00345D60E1